MKKEDFDRYTKGQDSPSKQTYRYSKGKPQPKKMDLEETDKLLRSPEQLEEERKQENLRRRQDRQTDQFQKLGVKGDDKMLYFLLKWIFNAIKIESDEDDERLKGLPYVRKVDLIKQLNKNKDLVDSLGFKNMKEVKELVKFAPCRKENCFVWDEFCDFFFLKDKDQHERLDTSAHWWRNIDAPEEEGQEEEEKENQDLEEVNKDAPRYGGYDFQVEKKEVKMTPALAIL